MHVLPTDLHFAHTGFAKSFAGAFEFGQGTNSGFAQAWNQRHENGGGGNRIAARAVAALNFYIGPAGDGIERKVGQIRRQQIHHKTHIETAWRSPAHAGQFAFAFQHRQIETAGTTDQYRIPAPGVEALDDFAKIAGLGDVGIANAVNDLIRGGYRHPRIDQFLKTLRLIDGAVHDAHRAELNHARLAGVESGGFAVKRNRVQR